MSIRRYMLDPHRPNHYENDLGAFVLFKDHQAAIDSAVNAERERWAKIVEAGDAMRTLLHALHHDIPLRHTIDDTLAAYDAARGKA